jgi:hypothetical protein
MFKYFVMASTFMLVATHPALAGLPSPKSVLHSDKSIYIDITDVYGPDGSRGTSYDLNILISQQATRTHGLVSRFHAFAAPSTWRHVIRTYDRKNIRYKPGYKKCNYSDALRCGIMNKHWTLISHVTVGTRYSTITMLLYNERGQLMTSSQKTAWGQVRWSPNWKKTVTTDSGNCVDVLDPTTGIPYQRCSTPKTTSVHEEWPPEMKELPPLVTPRHVHQAIALLYMGITRDFMRK